MRDFPSSPGGHQPLEVGPYYPPIVIHALSPPPVAADDRPGCIHVISHCVRRAFLCGDAADYHRGWVRVLIQQASAAYTIDVLAYAVMLNHLHIVIRTDPERVATSPTSESGLWIAPMVRATIDQPDGCACTAAITLDEYLSLVEATGSIVRDGKRSAIPTELAPILDRRRLNGDAWLVLMRSGGQLGLGSLGALASGTRETLRRGARWIIDTTACVYADDQPAEPATA